MRLSGSSGNAANGKMLIGESDYLLSEQPEKR
ncbi:hypothetical protein MESS2_p120018 [Mesorhizobium metallidurans STM 2683]|uniref:Uncharacterized protein n=1 Tax=Mesorhizobium metallidurans STM 2683 TaxID=1297569 RepID=M5EZ29_9HYPH|nr:hypothetical protein MESS2_p120018 [Mesorhizobium metallidurans STM 2683]